MVQLRAPRPFALFPAAAVAGILAGAVACSDGITQVNSFQMGLVPDSVDMVVGEELEFEAFARDDRGRAVTDLNVTWTILSPGAIEILSSTATGSRPTATVRAVAPGKSFLRAQDADGAGYVAPVIVHAVQ